MTTKMDFIDEARQRRQAIQNELMSLMRRKASLEFQLEGLTTFLRGVGEQSQDDAPDVGYRINLTKLHRSPRKEAIAKVVEQSLREHSPLTTRDLLTALNMAGMPIPSEGYLSTTLSRDDRFVANRKDGWTLKEKTPDADNDEGSDLSDLV